METHLYIWPQLSVIGIKLQLQLKLTYISQYWLLSNHDHVLIITENLEIVDLLIKGGANLNVEDNNWKTPLHLACSNGSLRPSNLLTLNYKQIIKLNDENYAR